MQGFVQLALQMLPQFARGVAMTLVVSLAASAIGTALAVGLLVARVEGGKIASHCIDAYVSFFRGTPFLIQLMLAYYVLPQLLGLDEFPPMVAGVLALCLNTAAFSSEILRGSYLTIARGQRLAGLSLGMRRWQVWRYVLLWSTLVRAIPPLTGEVCTVIKGSSLLSVISVLELTAVTRDLNNITSRPLEVFLLAGILYGCMLIVVVVLAQRVEALAARRGGHAS